MAYRSTVPSPEAARLYARGSRQPVRTFGRRVKKALVVRAILLGQRVLPTSPPEVFRIEPAPRGDAERADLAARLNWHLAASPIPIVEEEPSAVSPAAAPHMSPSLVHPHPNQVSHADGADHVLLRSVTLQSLARRGRRLGATTIIDPNFYLNAETEGYTKLVERFVPTRAIEADGEDVEELLRRRVDGGTAVIVGTGPSADALDVSKVDADVRITCNSAVRNHDWIREFAPTVIAVGDPIYHFGPSCYAARFREDLLRALQVTDAKVVLPTHGATLLQAHHPEIADRLIVLHGGAAQWRWPVTGAPKVRDSGNALTRYMLPLALALADRVAIAGCDGRKPSERFFWSHSPLIQYDDELMNTLPTAHPAWFRDRSYKSYYKQHCQDLEEFVTLAEGAGKSVTALTPSFIPALTRRPAV